MKHVPKYVPLCHRVGGIVLYRFRALYGFKGLVLNVDGSVLVACSVGVLENQLRSDSQR